MSNFYERVCHLRRQNPPMSWEEIGSEFGVTGECARSKYRRIKIKIEEGEESGIYESDDDILIEQDDAAKVFFGPVKRTEDVNWREFLEHAVSTQKINEKLADDQRIGCVTIQTDKPIGLVHTGDWHLGDATVDYTAWKNDMEFILSEPSLYMAEYGDTFQNMRSFKTLSAVFSQVLTPTQQAYMMRSVIDELTDNDKLVAKLDGNHDAEFDERIFGEALQKYLLTKMKAPRFKNRGLLKLTVGNQIYTVLMFHKSRFRSFMRTTHGNYREYQLSYPADIVAGGHDHQPGFESMDHYTLARQADMPFGGESWLIKVGTYQDNDYGWKYFHDGGIGNPTTVLFPDVHKIVPFRNPIDAVRYIGTF